MVFSTMGEPRTRRRIWPMSQPTARPTATPPVPVRRKPDGRASEGEGAGDGGADGYPVGHQRGGIIDQALALEDGGEDAGPRRWS